MRVYRAVFLFPRRRRSLPILTLAILLQLLSNPRQGFGIFLLFLPLLSLLSRRRPVPFSSSKIRRRLVRLAVATYDGSALVSACGGGLQCFCATAGGVSCYGRGLFAGPE